MKQNSVLDFCHSEDSSCIDSNFGSTVCVTIDGEKEDHAKRVFLARTNRELYELFLQSDVVEQYNTTYPEYSVPGMNTFKDALCNCCSKPVMQLCVDILFSKTSNYMKALERFICNNKKIREELEKCNCEMHRKLHKPFTSLLDGRVKTLVEATCCAKVPQPSLKYGAGSNARTPRVIPWRCVRDKCTECGVD